MDGILICPTCGHGVLRHDHDRCKSDRCGCTFTRTDVVDAEIELAKREMVALWAASTVTG